MAKLPGRISEYTIRHVRITWQNSYQEKRRTSARCISPRFLPNAVIQNWVKDRRITAALRTQANYLDCALPDFSGFIAADELYDGPFCILSVVDYRTFKRLSYRLLDHDATHPDVVAFFGRFLRWPPASRL